MLIYVSYLQTLGWIQTKERGLPIQGVWRKQIRKQEQVDTGLEEGRALAGRQREGAGPGQWAGPGQGEREGQRGAPAVTRAAGQGAGHLHGRDQEYSR